MFERKDMKLVPVILSGGVGSRLWPLSRQLHPKPFIKLKDSQSLIQKTYLRSAALDGVEEIITVTNRDLFFYTKDEFDAVVEKPIKQTYLLEPTGRNSLPAIALAAHYAQTQYGPDCLLLVLPADHLIDKLDAFQTAVKSAQALAQTGKLVTFGIQPNAPKTGFGYIEASGNKVLNFVEKPNLETAKRYLESGDFLWNSGMFCLKTSTFWSELEHWSPLTARQAMVAFEHASRSQGDHWQQVDIRLDDFERMPDLSVDYGIFEKTKHAAVVPCDIGWSDIGSWMEFGALHPKDAKNNHTSGEVLLEDVNDCIVQGHDKLIAALGIENLIIADSSDALLIAHKSRSQDVRQIVSQLKHINSPIYREFPTVHRPWGTYTVLQVGELYKLKSITVKPGGQLSLQSHQHRNEHWVVVKGCAQVTNGDQVIQLEKNQSTYIPAGHKHRLENLQKEALILIEVQCGDYLGEDDIIRYDDVYSRVAEIVD